MANAGDLEIWHNPRCSTSRKTLDLLEARGLTPKIVFYLEAPPSAARLTAVLKMLHLEPRKLMRTKEEAYMRLHLDDAALGSKELIAAMVENPILIERPIVIRGDRAALGRPPENVLALLVSPGQ